MLPRSTSILSPIADFLCVGGLSILVLVPLLASGVDLTFGGMVGFGAGVLWPRFW